MIPAPAGADAPPDFDIPPTRVVSLSPALTETLIDLGLGKVLVGVSNMDPVAASRFELAARIAPEEGAAQQVSALEPELVLTTEWPVVDGPQIALDEEAYPRWHIAPRSVRATIDMMWGLVRLLNSAQSGLRISALETTFEWTTMASYAREAVPVGCLLARDDKTGTWQSVGADTYTSDLIATCGGRNVFADDPDAVRIDVDVEQVRAAAPQVLLVASAGEIPHELEELAGRVYAVERATLTWPGTRLARALQTLPPLLQSAA